MSQKVFIQLGRFGDEVILLPCWLELYRQTGEKPIVIVARDFASIFHGTSYVQPDVVNVAWYGGVFQAAKMAALKYGEYTITQCHGLGHATDQTKFPSFGEAMWAVAGFAGRYGTLPMVFDRRNPERERKLFENYAGGKPILAFNFTGRSSPFPYRREVFQRLARYRREFTMLDLNYLKAKYLYDLLGIYDAAAGLISIDTSTCHLAAASPVPLLAYVRGGWSSAIPKPGAVKIEYAEALAKLDAIDEFVERIRKKEPARELILK